jgi:hypothetical protein
MKALPLFVMCALLAGCSSGTFVVLDFPSGPPDTVVSMLVALKLDGKSANTAFNAKASTFDFPTSGTLEIGDGSGALTVSVTAVDQSGRPFAFATGTVTVEHGQTVHLSLPLGAPPNPDLGPVDGGNPGLTITPTTHDFGAAVVATTSQPFTFTVKNEGGATAGPLNYSLSGTNAADFSLSGTSSCINATLATADTCTIVVEFTPQTAGSDKSATLTVGDPNSGLSATATLTGRAASAGALSFGMTTSHLFASLMVGQSGGDATFTLSNTGATPTGTITVSLGGSNADSFVLVPGEDACTGMVLGASGMCTVVVRFAPNARGPLTATLSATATPGGLATIDLSGTGLAVGSLMLSGATTMAAPYDFGTVDVGSSSTMHQLITVTNSGDDTLGALSLAGLPDLSELSLTSETTCVVSGANATVLAGGQSCVLGLALTPLGFGTKNIEVTVSATPGGDASSYSTGVGHDQVTIAVANGSGGTGTIVDALTTHVINCGTMCTETFDRTTTAPSLSFTAQPDTGFSFASWTMAPAAACTGGASSATCALTLDASVPGNTVGTPYTYTAGYAALYTVSYARTDIDYGSGWSASGLGTLSSDQGASCSAAPCTAVDSVASGTLVTVTATGSSVTGQGHASARFTGSVCTGGTIDSITGAATCTFTVTGNLTVPVTFSAHNYAFVSSTVLTNGNLQGSAADGLSGADATCQANAAAANLPGTFVAWLASSTKTASSRLGTGSGWVRADGLPVFHAASDLSGGALLYPIDVTATGAAGASNVVFTNANADGTEPVAGANPCDDWTSAAPVSASSIVWGSQNSGAAGWSNRGTYDASACNGVSFNLYCLGTDIDYAMSPIAPPAGSRAAFLSVATFTPVSGDSITNLDDLCTAEAGSFPDHHFLAFATDGTNPAESRFNAGTPWARRDGVLLVSSSSGLLSTTPSLDLAAWDVFSNGAYATATDNLAWTGAPTPAGAAADANDCVSWSSTAGSGITGSVLDRATFFDSGTPDTCANAHHVLCLEP